MSKPYKIAYIRSASNFHKDRDNTFDKYLMRTLQINAKVDIYLAQDIKKIPLKYKKEGFGFYRIRTWGPTILTFFSGYFLTKKLYKKYDLLISDDPWIYVGMALHNGKKTAIHVQSPERSLYDLYYMRLRKKKGLNKLLQLIWVYTTRPLYTTIMKRAKNVLMFANSNNVAKRIYSYWGLDAKILYPIAAPRTCKPKKPKNFPFSTFYLNVNRIVPEKRLEICTDVFRDIKKNIVIVGWGGERNYIKEMRMRCNKPNILLLENLPENELVWLYQNCTKVLQTNFDEDFGMVPLEANSEGKATIAVAEGGYLETVKEGVTGTLICQPYRETLKQAILDNKLYDQVQIKKYVQSHFSFKGFINTVWKYIEPRCKL